MLLYSHQGDHKNHRPASTLFHPTREYLNILRLTFLKFDFWEPDKLVVPARNRLRFFYLFVVAPKNLKGVLKKAGDWQGRDKIFQRARRCPRAKADQFVPAEFPHRIEKI